MEKKTTLTERMIMLIDTEIERVLLTNQHTSSRSVLDLETKGYLQGLNEARKMIDYNVYDIEIQNLKHSYDEGYFQGAELTEQTSEEFIEESFKTINNNFDLISHLQASRKTAGKKDLLSCLLFEKPMQLLFLQQIVILETVPL